MKRILKIALCVFMFFAISGGLVFAKVESVELDRADLNYDNLTASGKCWDFNAGAPGSWGGESDERAVTAFLDDDDDAGYCILGVLGDKSKARRLELRVLDGMADDSFEVYVKNPAEKWVLVYSYSDQHDTETWVKHDIYSFPAGKGQGKKGQDNTVEVKILLTGKPWSGFNTYGQLAVDYMAIYEH